MSPNLDKAVARLLEATLEVVWAQWRALGPVAGSGREARAIVDPEALVLVSLALNEHERRLGRVVAWWARSGARLLSVQRLRNLARDYPDTASQAIAGFARAALESGDARWRPVARGGGELAVRKKDLAAAASPRAPAALLLKLRLGLGVGIKADVLGYLVGLAGAGATVQAIAYATAYYPRAVRRAVEELAAAGFVEARPTSPASYRVNMERYESLLQLGKDPPAWRPWYLVFTFVFEVLRWAEEARGQTDYVASSAARDLVLRRRARLHPDIKLPEPEIGTGESYLAAFGEALGEAKEWLLAVV